MENAEAIIKRRHRFKSFSQQIAEVNADSKAAFKMYLTKSDGSNTSSYFYTTLLSTLNRTADQSYSDLAAQLLKISKSLLLILSNKDQIFELINDYIKKPYSEIMGGIENVLNLIAQLARDLRDDFYPYFNEIFINLANIFAPKDAKFTDDFFRCILFLLHVQRKSLIEDIENVLNLFVNNYFAKDDEFLRRLSAQSLAFLMRQIPDKKKEVAHKQLLQIVSEFISSEDTGNLPVDGTNNDAENQDQNDDESESPDEDENDNSPKHKNYVVDMTVIKMTKQEKIIQTLGYLYYYEIKNIQSSLWSNAPNLIPYFLQSDEQFVYEAFLQMIDRVSKHVAPQAQNVQDFLISLAEQLPEIDSILAFKTFIILMENRNQSNNMKSQVIIFSDTDILIEVLNSSWGNCPIDIICQFISRLNNFHIHSDKYSNISDIIVSIISNAIEGKYDINFVLDELKDSRKIAEISSESIFKFAESNFDETLPYLDKIFSWSRPHIDMMSDNTLINKANKAFSSNRKFIVPLFKYLHNSESYKLLSSLKDLSLPEYGILFTLMSEFDPKGLVKQPPNFIQYLLKLESKPGSKSIKSNEALQILYHLLRTCKIYEKDSMNVGSDIFKILYDKIDFNTADKDTQRFGSAILSLFLDPDKEIIDMNGDELIIKSAESIFNLKENTLIGLRTGEAMIEQLATRVTNMRKCKNTINPLNPIYLIDVDRLFNLSLGFARCNYIKFREFDSKLIGEIIQYNPQRYGPLVTHELETTFPWKADQNTNVHFLERTLFSGIQRAEYIDDKIVNLIVRFCNLESENTEDEEEMVKTKVSLLDTLASISRDENYRDKVKEIGFDFLTSTNSKIRQSAFNILYNIIIVADRKLNEQQRDKIKTSLEVFVNGENNQALVTFPDFLQQYQIQREFISNIAISLSIGTVREFLSEKKRNKKKFKSLSKRLLQAISYFDSKEVAPLIQSFLVKKPTASDYRRFPKYFIALISTIPMHFEYEDENGENFYDKSAAFLLSSLKLSSLRQQAPLPDSSTTKKSSSLDSREINNSLTACALFFESVAGYESFADDCLTVLDKALLSRHQSAIRLTTAISIQFPSLFKNHDEIVQILIDKLTRNTTAEVVNIITRIITEIPKYHEKLINSFNEILTNSKIMKREQIWQSFNIFLSSMRESFATPEFIDLLITFLVNYRHIETIPILNGLSLTKEQFSELSKLIAYPLELEFRHELIPLIAEFMGGEYAEAFIKLNKDDLAEKTITYRSLDSAGDYSFIFALQSFSDLQLNDFSLRAATVGFISRVIQNTPSIVFDYVLPAIKFHVKKEHSRIPPSEILMILNTIIKTVPDIEKTLPTIKRLSEQHFFLTLGSFDAKVRSKALGEFTEFIKEKEDWNEEEINEIVFPLLTQFATTQGIEEALSSLLKYANDTVIKRLLRRLIRSISHGSTIHLLIALCKAQAFKKEDVAPQLLSIVMDEKKPSAIQLRLIPALLSVDHSKKVVHQIIESIAPKLPSLKEETRKVGQQSLTELVKTLNNDDYFILFQDLRSFLKQGRQIPVLFMSLNNMLANAVNPQGSFDNFIELFSEVLLEDIFGHMGQMRIQKASEIPEAKKCLSYSSFQYLAEYVTFKTTARNLIDSVLKKFETLTTIEQSKGAKKIILSLAEGFTENETVDASTLVDVIGYLLDLSDKIKKDDDEKQRLKDKNQSRPVYGKMYEEDYFIENPTRSYSETGGNDIVKRLGNNYLVSLLAVRLLYIFFEKELFDIEDNQQVELLESLLQRLWGFIQKAQDTETIIVSLSILEHYIKLPSFSKFLPDVVTFLTIQISKMNSAADNFGKAVFKLLTEVLTTYDQLELPTKFTIALVTFCEGQLDVHDSCDAVFGMLRLVMTRRQDIPKIYDLAKPALELVVRAISPDVRKNAALFVAQFMSTYKVSPNQFKDLLKFALANLASPKVNSRRSMLIFLSQLISDCPTENLDQYTELMLAYLGMRIANESDERAIVELHEVIGKLLNEVSGSRFLSMWNLMIKWCSSEGKQVRTGLLLLAVCVEYCSSALTNLFDSLQQVVDVHINSENYKVKIAAIELHRQIVIAYNQLYGEENENDQITFNLNLLPTEKLIELVTQKETTKTGCELLHWYLSNYLELFGPSEEDLSNIANSMINIVVSYHALYSEASESLFLALSNLSAQSDINNFFDTNHDIIYSIFKDTSSTSVEKTILAMMRIFVQVIVTVEEENQANEDFDLILKNILLFIFNAQIFASNDSEINKKKKKSELEEATDKALELVRHNVDVETFTRIWTSILEEDKERKNKEMTERKEQEELDPEAYKQRVREERERKREEERRKRYLNDGEKATLHPFGLDGKRVEKVPLAPEFQ